MVELLEGYSNHDHQVERFRSLLSLPRSTKLREPVRSRKQVQRRLTADEQAELLNRYLAGERAHQLARAFQIDRRTVATLLKNTGLRRSRSLTPEKIDEAVALYAQGWSCQRIGERFGRHYSTIWLALKARGVQLRQPWDRP
jgi:DNA-directed RNA polymerase specialized sigma24 family protein